MGPPNGASKTISAVTVVVSSLKNLSGIKALPKNLLVTSSYPYHEKFAKLTQQEKDWGLLDDLGKIRDRQGWNNCLKENCAELKGHRVVWKKGVNPYQIKLIRSKIRAQQIERRKDRCQN